MSETTPTWDDLIDAATQEGDGPAQAALFEQAADALAQHLADTSH